MNDETALIKQATAELGIDKPIMSYKVVGDRIELHLFGGSTAVWTARPMPTEDAGPDLAGPTFEDLSLRELRILAGARKIVGRSKMNRAQLIEALEVDDGW